MKIQILEISVTTAIYWWHNTKPESSQHLPTCMVSKMPNKKLHCDFFFFFFLNKMFSYSIPHLHYCKKILNELNVHSNKKVLTFSQNIFRRGSNESSLKTAMMNLPVCHWGCICQIMKIFMQYLFKKFYHQQFLYFLEQGMTMNSTK